MQLRHVFLLGVLVLVLGACGGGTDTDQDTTGETEALAVETETPAVETETPADDGAATEQETATAAEPTVAVASTDLGNILVDGDGLTLYLFLQDEQGDPACRDGCIQTWPLLEAPATAGEGADGGLLGTVEHSSGATQVTYNNWPLYYFANDEQPGDVNGQGVGANWYVVSPEGEPVQDGG